MYCVSCGKNIREGARFCSSCGEPVFEEEVGADRRSFANAANDTTKPFSSETRVRGTSSIPSQQGKSGSGYTRWEPSARFFAALALGLLAVVVFIALMAAQYFGLGGTAAEQPSFAPSGTAASSLSGTPTEKDASSFAEPASTSEHKDEITSPNAEKTLSEEERVIESLDGWWLIGRAWKQDHYLYFHGGTVDVYSSAGTFDRTVRTIEPDDVIRKDDGLGDDKIGGPGYFIYGPGKNRFGMYLCDDMPDTLHQMNSDGTGYSGGDSYSRVEPPQWAAGIERASSRPTGPDVSAASNRATELDARALQGEYILPDSATRRYSRSELAALDNRTLFLARNEIYARHGRRFKNNELQRYFNSMPWYRGTISADTFDDEMLSDVELANAHRMLDIEKARGSQYV